jgi:acetyl-CoA carboxylase biotin carboxylase subunit
MLGKLLIANRGEIARRIIRTARAMGIPTVAVYSDVDAREAFVREADEAVRLGGAAPGESYLRAEAIIDAARRTGADAIHPGYGFLAENAEFARACGDAGITFVGPTPEAIEAMGSKLEAKRRLAEVGVPVLPDTTDPESAAADVGFPLLVKPSAGGGGKGMRVVRAEPELAAAVDASRREAKAAFGDDTLLFERYVETGRHVEIQILGDSHGEVIHLGERECSIQRRHQKILEESPSVAIGPELRERMGEAAVAAGKSIRYVSAGTVEFLLGDDEDFYFLEVNTRLQVEHPVTEEVTGIDLVREQLRVASGERLSVEGRAPRRGHAIEIRLNAEDPEHDFRPSPGRVSLFQPAEGPGVRLDTFVESGTVVPPFYDSMIAKLIVWDSDRDAAIARAERALRETVVEGVPTTRDLALEVLASDPFRSGEYSTSTLESLRAFDAAVA